jgi:hypothetical protein
MKMALNNTINTMNNLLAAITKDLEKSTRGNKAASQRVRTGTVRLEKVAKLYRKESITAEKGGKLKKAPKDKKVKKVKKVTKGKKR